MIKSYTDTNQSKKLTEILPLESADMNWHVLPSTGFFARAFPYKHDNGATEGVLPCWSLAALLGVLPKFIGDYSKCLYYDVGGYYCGYMYNGYFMLTIQKTKADNPIDACVTMIEKLYELKIL